MTTTRWPLGMPQPRWTWRPGLRWALLAGLAWTMASRAWAQQAEPIDPVVQEIARLWEKRQRLFRTAIFKAEGKGLLHAGYCSMAEEYKHLDPTPAQDFVHEEKVTLYLDFERNRVRNEMTISLCRNLEEDGTREPFVLYEIYIWDGAHQIHYIPPEKNPALNPMHPAVEVYYPPVVVLQKQQSFGLFAAGLLRNRHDSPKPEKLRVPPDPGAYRVVGRARHQDRECVVLRSLSYDGSWDEVWVDVERDAAIVRLDYNTRNNQPFWTAETSYRPLAGTWVPAEFRLWSFGRESYMKIRECTVNAELDPELFRVRVERGTRIQSAHFDRIFAAPHAGDVLQLEPGDDESMPEGRAGAGHVFWVTAVVLAALVARAAWGLHKRMRKRSQRPAP